MEELDNIFLNYKTKSEFIKSLEQGIIKDTSIAFIEDVREIFTHGRYYIGRDTINEFNTGCNEVTTLENLPIDKHTTIATIATQSVLSFSSNPAIGNEYRVFIIPTESFKLDLPNTEDFIPVSNNYSFDLKVGESILILDISCITDGRYLYTITSRDQGSIYYQDKLFFELTEDEEHVDKISDLFDLKPEYTLTLQVQVMGAGGSAAGPGNNWGLYHGGSSSASCNGGIVIAKFPVTLDSVITYKKESDGYYLSCMENTIKAFNGPNASKGGNADFFGKGSGGDGPSGLQNNVALNSETSENILDYYDVKAPNGLAGMAGNSDAVIKPNDLPDVQYSKYSKGCSGVGIWDDNNVPGTGGIIIRCYYEEK